MSDPIPRCTDCGGFLLEVVQLCSCDKYDTTLDDEEELKDEDRWEEAEGF